jgi:SNF2 family DNA or RNA helicase
MSIVAEITTDGRHVLAKIPYAGGEGVKLAHQIPGHKAVYEKGSRGQDRFAHWRFPLTMDTCRTFRRLFGENLRVHKELAEWARGQIHEDEATSDLKAGRVPVSLEAVKREAPKLYAALSSRSYQPVGVAFMAKQKGCLLGDDPGLGKTLQTLGSIIEADAKKILVTCPRTATRSVWEAETRRWAPGIAVFVAQGDRATRSLAIAEFMDHDVSIPGCRKMLVVNTEMVRAKRLEVCPNGTEPASDCSIPKETRNWKGKLTSKHEHKFMSFPDWPELHTSWWDAIVMDESHQSLASTYNIQSKHITQVRYGAMQIRGRLVKDGLAIALSGTPSRSRLTKLWGTLNWCRPDVFRSYWDFAGTHFGVEEGSHGMVVAGGAKNPEPIDPVAFQNAISPYVLQRSKALAAPDLPDKQYMGSPPPDNPEGFVGVWLDMDPKQKHAYDDMKKMARARVRDGEVSATGILAEITRLRQFATTFGRVDSRMVYQQVYPGRRGLVEQMDFSPDLPSNKLDWLMEFIREREDADSKLVVASSFTSVIELFASAVEKEFGPVYQITGKTSDRERARVVKNFNDTDDDVRVCMINSRAGGVAITLDKCCDDLVFIDLPWTSDEATQVEDRIHRVSRIHQVQIHRLLSIGTIDKWMADNSDEQRAALLSGRPEEMMERVLEEILGDLWAGNWAAKIRLYAGYQCNTDGLHLV